ncbi:MAG: diphthamide biosynthesis enzyme Dph2 [Candidatus Bathyarchaeia archaeon]
MFDFELNHLINEIARYSVERLLLQLPEGVRPFAFKLAESIEAEADVEVIISGDSCYGACDIPFHQARELDADILVHYGHSKLLSKTEIPVIYIELKVDINLEKLLEEAYPLLANWKSIGISTTVQHTHQINRVKEALESRGVRSLIGGPADSLSYPGQILGCNYDTALKIAKGVKGFLYVGGGKFHPIGLALVTGKPVIVFNPFNNTAKRVERGELMDIAKKRMAAINASKKAEIFGVVVSSKIGQRRLSVARALRGDIIEKGLKSYIIYMDEIRGERLLDFTEADAFIITACPRIALDGLPKIDKPLLTIGEAKVVLGELEWEELWQGGYFNAGSFGK